ncbi:hypothetical protein ACFQ6N_36595 [Kitasatospora sp. NPDC056446]|uniref:hypothetical protein n=1 Tax=Kitasatospora sp. NPDC056446 TaxID=3345819 RepID=UPI0036CC6336
MTDFASAFSRFCATPYPGYPALEELRDWNSELLTVDGHIAGYAYRVHGGQMQARQIPGLVEIVLRVESLRASLDTIHPNSTEDRKLIGEYQSYISALESMVRELDQLARQQR